MFYFKGNLMVSLNKEKAYKILSLIQGSSFEIEWSH